MAFAAYETRRDGNEFSYHERDEARGVLGKLSPRCEPVAVAATLDELRLLARAHLGEFPDGGLYLADADNLVLEIVLNERHHASLDRARRNTAIFVVLLVLCATCLIGTAIANLGVGGIICFAGISALYLATVKLGIVNEVESAVLCEIILILLLIVIPLSRLHAR